PYSRYLVQVHSCGPFWILRRAGFATGDDRYVRCSVPYRRAKQEGHRNSNGGGRREKNDFCDWYCAMLESFYSSAVVRGFCWGSARPGYQRRCCLTYSHTTSRI